MTETATEAVPEGLEEFFVEAEDPASEELTWAMEAEYSDIVGASVIKSWVSGSALQLRLCRLCMLCNVFSLLKFPSLKTLSAIGMLISSSSSSLLKKHNTFVFL